LERKKKWGSPGKKERKEKEVKKKKRGKTKEGKESKGGGGKNRRKGDGFRWVEEHRY